MTADEVAAFFVGGPLYGVYHMLVDGKVPEHYYGFGDGDLYAYSLIGMTPKIIAARGVIYEYSKKTRDNDVIISSKWCWYKDLEAAVKSMSKTPTWQAGTIMLNPIKAPGSKVPYVPEDEDAPKRTVAVRHVTSRKITGVRPGLHVAESA